ncbi:hypothetical protein A5790_07765 [Mycobacterium sp. 852002-51152_SCH6134967]|uniref:hypothetical protein n=1 Tax=Mycobacterium sp. 852002-51152_SCH6134967 TaxID=1834096 RepID=UPI0007FDE6BF|nr:hypothetical protein [Mycobacterium sp. 852002-51152_SCH6134967]OBF95587.1 hypothetical protein A5790_07765 [Mycobacterium sp. 852002-51152_SCH6134967]
MPTVGGALVAAAVAAVTVVALAPPAHAADAALNGRYLATSNGDFAMTNDVYRDLPSVRSTWTIAMTCIDDVNCSGTVDSDAGWSADIVITNSEYIVKRELPDWQRCADGTGRTVTGHQSYRFFPVGDEGFLLPGSRVFAGFDKTSGESGACSLNEMTEIEMPFRLDKLD